MDLSRDMDPTPVDRVVRFFLNPMRRFRGLVILAYASGIAGLSMTLLFGPFSTTSSRMTVGLALMFVSFVILFYLSITVVETHGGR